MLGNYNYRRKTWVGVVLVKNKILNKISSEIFFKSVYMQQIERHSFMHYFNNFNVETISWTPLKLPVLARELNACWMDLHVNVNMGSLSQSIF